MRYGICGAAAGRWNGGGDVKPYRWVFCASASRSISAEQRYEDYYCRPVPASPDARYHEWLARAEAVIGRGRLLAGSGGFFRTAVARGWGVDATEISKSALDGLHAAETTCFRGDILAALARYQTRACRLLHTVGPLLHCPTGRLSRRSRDVTLARCLELAPGPGSAGARAFEPSAPARLRDTARRCSASERRW